MLNAMHIFTNNISVLIQGYSSVPPETSELDCATTKTYTAERSISIGTEPLKAPTGRIFMKFDIGVFFENMSRNFKFHSNRTITTGTLREIQYTFLILPR